MKKKIKLVINKTSSFLASLFNQPKKHLKTWLVIFLALTTGLAAFFFLLSPQATEAAWWDETWLYRRAIQISNSNGEDLTDFQVAITLDTATLITAGKMQGDCDDLRITDQNGQILPHWIEENNPGCDNVATKVWVKIPTVHKGDNATTVYAYYGNAQAKNAENGDNVFEFFDDFNGASLDTNKWTWTGSATKSVSNGSLTITNNASQMGYISHNLDSTKITVGWRASLSQTSTYYWLTSVRNNPTMNSHALQATPDTIYGYDFANNITYSIGNSYHSWKMDFDGTNAYVYIDNIQKSNKAYAILPPIVHFGEFLSSASHGGTYVIDYVYIAKTEVTLPSAGSAGSEEKSPSPAAYWKFDEGQGQVAQDSTSNNNDGTLGANSGSSTDDPAWITEDQCINGKCLEFDGTNDVVTVASTVSDIQTVSFWAKVNSTATTEQLIDLNGTDYITSVSGVVTANGFGTETIYVDGQVGTTLQANRWHYVSVTTDTPLTGSAIKIGQVSTNYGQGFIDEVKIYPYARTAAQIKGDFNQGAVKIGTPNQGTLSDGLVGYWKMDENTGTTAYNSAGNYMHLSIIHRVGVNPTGPWGGGKFGSAFLDAGYNYPDYEKASTAWTAPQQSSFTISTWIKPLTAPTTYPGFIISRWWGDCNESYQPGWALQYSVTTKKITMKIAADSCGPDGTLVTNSTFNIDTWYHLVAVHESGKNIRMYVNGQLDSSLPYTLGLNPTPPNLSFGCGANNNDCSFSGLTDETRLYNRALSDDEVKNLYEWVPGPVAHFKLDEGAGSAAADSSGYGRSGAVVNGLWAPGKFGGGLKFDGSGDYLEITDF